MKIGIIVYSHTGNTLSVAEKAQKALKGAGHLVEIKRVEPVADDPNSSSQMKLKTAPEILKYDTVIFASPVQAFSLARIMKMYLSQISGLAGKRVYCFVTQHFKKPWLGGNRAVRQIKSYCKAKGAQAASCGIVNWSGSTREAQIEDIIKTLSSI